MDYKNGKVILPSELLEQLQEYAQGNLIYIPKKEENRIGWGENSGAKTVIANRNFEICEAHRNGIKAAELAAIFCLSEDSIRKILRTAKRKGDLQLINYGEVFFNQRPSYCFWMVSFLLK